MTFNKFFLVALFALIIIGNASASETSLFGDNFNDGSITDWDINAGTWSAATNQMVGGALDGAIISHSVSGMVAGGNYRIYYKNDPNVGALNNSFYWMTDENGLGNLSGYGLLIQSTTTRLRRYDNGSITNLITSAGIGTGVLHDVNISHSIDGNISIWIDGNPIGSVIDTNYTSGSKIAFSTENGVGNGIWDDLNVFVVGDYVNYFYIVEETNVATGLDANLTINGIDWNVGVDGNFIVDSSITFPATFVVSKTGYSTRTLTYDTNEALWDYRNIGLRPSTETKDIDFTFYGPDEETILSNTYISVIRNSVLVAKGKTDSLGHITLNLAPQDSVYSILTYSGGTDTNIVNTYSTVSVSISRPKDEATNSSIAGGFNIDVGGLGVQNYTNESTFPFTTISIIGNTTSVYNLRIVDYNAAGQQYYARNYVLSALGDISSISIQPYLISLVDGILVNLRVYDRPSNITISDIRTTIRTGIASSYVIIEDNITDATGISQVVLLAQKQYGLTITSPNGDTNYFSANITASSTSQSFYIDYTTTQSGLTTRYITISYSPKTNTLSGITATIDLNIFASYSHDKIIIETLDQNQGNRRITYSESTTQDVWITSITPTLADYNYSNILVLKVIVVDGDVNTTWTKNYFITSTGYGGITNLTGLQGTFNPLILLIIMVVSITLFIGYLGIGKFGNFDQSVFIGAVLLGIVSYIFFTDFLKYVIAALLVAAFAWMWGRVNR